jgi:thiazole/oxazole-forming peptide maturase SagD family component
LVLIEQEQGDFIVSPLLGEGRICERCWINRRAATLDPAELPAGSRNAAGLIAAVQNRKATAIQPQSEQQRAAMARILLERHGKAASTHMPSFPPLLSRITPSGSVVNEAVLPLPDCQLCGWRTPCSSSQSLDHVFGRTAGIVADVQELRSLDGEPSFPYVLVSRVANTFLDPERSFWSGASGKGATVEAAFGSVIGESLERYGARFVSQPLITARIEHLDSAIDPSRLTGVHYSQAQAAGYEVDGAIAWVRGTSIRDRKMTTWLPASAVYLRLPEEFRTQLAMPQMTNGLACASTLAEAIDRALGEVLERHVFFSVWYGIRKAELADAERFTDLSVIDAFRNSGLEFRTALLVSIGNELTVASASCWPHHGDPSRPGFCIGLGVGTTPASAVRRATLEAAQVYRGLSWALRNPVLRQRAEQLKREPSLVGEPYDHALLYSRRSPEAVPSPFGLGAPRTADTTMTRSDVPLDEAFFVDLTPHDVRAATSWHVVRVVVPDALPYHFGEGLIPRSMLGFSACKAALSTDLLHPLS